MTRSSLFVLILVVSCRGATPRVQGPAEDAAPSFFVPGDGPMPDLRTCHEFRTLNVPARPADVLILFDRSESMLTEFSTGTRYSTVASLLGELVEVYQDKLRFGFQPFPETDGCGTDHSAGCCAGPPTVPVALGRGADIRAAIAAAQPPRGSTPTAEALRRARQYFAALDDGIPDRYVLLATDGRPSCDATGRLAEADVLDADGVRKAGACYDALAEVDLLVAAGIQVIVLGVGSNFLDAPGGQPPCLEELARRGRAMALPEDRPWYYSGTDREALEEALQKIFGGAIHPPCTLVLEAAPPDPERVSVYLDGRQVPRNRNYGWDYVSPDDTRELHFYGDYCRRIHRFQVSRVEVRWGCQPCTSDPRECE